MSSTACAHAIWFYQHFNWPVLWDRERIYDFPIVTQMSFWCQAWHKSDNSGVRYKKTKWLPLSWTFKTNYLGYISFCLLMGSEQPDQEEWPCLGGQFHSIIQSGLGCTMLIPQTEDLWVRPGQHFHLSMMASGIGVSGNASQAWLLDQSIITTASNRCVLSINTLLMMIDGVSMDWVDRTKPICPFQGLIVLIPFVMKGLALVQKASMYRCLRS